MAMISETLISMNLKFKLQLNQLIDMCTLSSLVKNGILYHVDLSVHKELKNVGSKVTVRTETQIFKLFFSEKFYKKILQYTKKQGREKIANKEYDWKELDINELKVFMGLLILIGFTKRNHGIVCHLWSFGPHGHPIFKTVILANRFKQIL